MKTAIVCLFLIAITVTPLVNAMSSADYPYCGIPPGQKKSMDTVLDDDDLELIQAHTFIRHGDRTSEAAGCWPNDKGVWDCELTQTSIPSQHRADGTLDVPYLFRRYYQKGAEPIPGTNCVQMQLTTRGLQQQMSNGASLKTSYVDSGFLPKNFNTTQILLRSDDMDRCIQSAEGLVLGMYPSVNTLESPVASSTVPMINIVTMGQLYQIFYPNSRVCPRVQELQNQAQEQSAYMNWQSNVMWPLQEKLATDLDWTINNVNVHMVWDCLAFHICHNQPMPPKLTDDVVKAVNDAVLKGNVIQNSYPSYTEQGKYQIGLLLQDMFVSMQNMTASDPSVPKFTLYSGHDSTIMPILYAYNVFDGLWSPYAAMINFELYKSSSTNQFSVQMLYDGKAMTIPGCNSTMCNWEEFSKITSAIIPSQEECQQ